MNYLLDTCVLSELIRPVPEPNVVNWVREQNESNLFLSVLTFGEIEKGIEKVTSSDKKNRLRNWVETDLKQRFKGRVLTIDIAVAIKWGEIQGKLAKTGCSMPVIDSLIAMTALTNNCIVVTRNTTDMELSNAELLNPWLN